MSAGTRPLLGKQPPRPSRGGRGSLVTRDLPDSQGPVGLLSLPSWRPRL